MDAKQRIIAEDTINNGFKLLISELNNNKIMDEILSTLDIDEQKNIIKKYISNVENLNEETIIELSEVLLYMVERTTTQKSMMIGRVKDSTRVERTKQGIKLIGENNRYVVIPYSKITNEIIGKELAKRIRKVF